MKCEEEGATQEMMTVVMICKGGQWAVDSAATEAATKCTEEGATKTETMSMGGFSMDMTYICKDGEWTMDMSNFGNMFGGDSTGGMNFGDFGGGNFGDFGGGDFGGGNFGDFGGGNFGGGALGGGAAAE